jgi:hypothetical protein
VLLIFGFAAEPLLRAAFGPKRLLAANSLFLLGVAFTVLAGTYLAIQYMLALKRTWFLVALGLVAIAEPVLLLQASRKPEGFAVVVLAVQAAGAILAFAMALRRDNAPPATARDRNGSLGNRFSARPDTPRPVPPQPAAAGSKPPD